MADSLHCSCSVEALKALTTRGKDQEVLRIMNEEGGWDLMKIPETHHRGVSILARWVQTTLKSAH